MQYDVTLFRNSGFNATNIPDSPELLLALVKSKAIGATELKGELKSLEINQDVQLDTLTVRCSLSQAKNVDFVMLDDNDTKTGKKFYAVIDRHMDAEDVCTFTVQQSCLLSYGGVNDLDILDGITERVHVGDDSKFYACEGDPLLNPTEPLEIKEEWVNPEDGAGRKYVFAECTVDPVNTLYNKEAVQVDYTDAGGNTSSCTYPALSYPENDTEYRYGSKMIRTGTTIYLLRNSDSSSGEQPVPETRAAMANLQALGIAQGAIIRQYEFPSQFASGMTMETVTTGAVRRLSGKSTEYPLSEIPSFVHTGHNNKLVDYSPVQKFGMMTAAGNSAEFNLEDLRDTNPNSPNKGKIDYSISMVSDPRPDGRPYYRPHYINGSMAGGNNYKNFWRNALAGMQWKQVPLVFQGASGSALNTQRFENSQVISYENYRHGQNKEWLSMAKSIINGASQSAQAWYDDSKNSNSNAKIAAVAGHGLNMLADVAGSGMNLYHNKKNYTNETLADVYDLYAKNFVVAPTVNFPYSSEGLRDHVGNACLCYQYRYTKDDANRIDKLLTMYGYRVAKPLAKSDFTNRKYFNYVACQNVSVTGHSQWVNDAIAAELRNGVRVWHVKPDKSYYNIKNPIV